MSPAAVLSRLSGEVKEIVGEQYQFRELLYQMTRRDLLLRYKQTVMGFGWAIFMPLVNTAVFSVIFTRVAPLQTNLPYPLFAYCGLLAWNFSASSLRFAVTSLTSNASLVTNAIASGNPPSVYCFRIASPSRVHPSAPLRAFPISSSDSRLAMTKDSRRGLAHRSGSRWGGEGGNPWG